MNSITSAINQVNQEFDNAIYKAAKENQEAIVWVDDRKREVSEEPVMKVTLGRTYTEVEKAEDVKHVIKVMENRFDTKPKITWIPVWAKRLANESDNFSTFQYKVSQIDDA